MPGIGTFFGAAESRATGIDIHPGATIDPQSRRIRAKCTLQTLPKMCFREDGCNESESQCLAAYA
jgi:hypothetical protein